LKFLLNEAAIAVESHFFDTLLVKPLNDGGMGSIALIPKEVAALQDRTFGKQASEHKFLDNDNVPVIASLYLDTQGHIYEIDIWKTDYSKLNSMPTHLL